MRCSSSSSALAFFASVSMLLGVSASPASAQRHVQYDTLSESTPAAITCGFCAAERFGVVFRQLSSGGGLLPTSFPLTVESIEIALASVQVQDMGFGLYQCVGSASGGPVDTDIELYAGATPPTGDILSMPPMGPWPGEELVWSGTVPITRSVATMDGGMMYNVMFNPVRLPMGTRVDTPGMTYLRVVVTVPASAATMGLCHTLNLSFQEPSAVPIRDEGRIENEINFIYALETPTLPPFSSGLAAGWYWNEDPRLTSSSGMSSTIQGDWGIRLNVIPAAPMLDAGPPTPDAGVAMDAGTPAMDSGSPPGDDAGVSAMCSADADCSGGERCVDGMCRRVSCAAASDCAGGMTCVEGMCRNLCTSDVECLGGQVCDTAMGYCVPVGTMPSDGGCGCRAASGPMPGWVWGLPLVAIVLRRRRRR